MALPSDAVTTAGGGRPAPQRVGAVPRARRAPAAHRRVDRLLWSAAPSRDDLPWVPAVDIEETDDAWIVEAEVPGVRREDVNVEVRDYELVVSGEIKERERKRHPAPAHPPQRALRYRVTLPEQPDPEGVDAKLEDGVLTVRVPKPEQTRRRRIEVQAGQPS